MRFAATRIGGAGSIHPQIAAVFSSCPSVGFRRGASRLCAMAFENDHRDLLADLHRLRRWVPTVRLEHKKSVCTCQDVETKVQHESVHETYLPGSRRERSRQSILRNRWERVHSIGMECGMSDNRGVRLVTGIQYGPCAHKDHDSSPTTAP